MSENTTEIVAFADDTASKSVDALIGEFKKSDVAVYSSIAGDSQDSKIRVLAAMTSAEPIGDHLDEVIPLVDFVIHRVELEDTDDDDVPNGRMIQAARTILVDVDGNAYYAISSVIVKRLYDIVGIMGEPSTWDNPVHVAVSHVKSGKGARRFFDLRVLPITE